MAINDERANFLEKLSHFVNVNVFFVDLGSIIACCWFCLTTEQTQHMLCKLPGPILRVFTLARNH